MQVNRGAHRVLRTGLVAIVVAAFLFVPSRQLSAAPNAAFDALKLQVPGEHALRILSPTVLELVRVNTKQPYPARVDSWDWVTDQGDFSPPNLSSIRVVVNGVTNSVAAVGFKRRALYAPLAAWDLRIGNYLYLKLGSPVGAGQSVQVFNNGTLWPTNWIFAAAAAPLRNSPAIHVNQEGYVPLHPKKAIIGYYLGDLGEMPVTATNFTLVNVSGTVVYSGPLAPRWDVGYLYSPTPYQVVYEADFTSFTAAGQYQLVVPGLGASLPFRIDEGIAMDFARTYALGLLHQRSGFNVAMPFTRFTHAADHTAPVTIASTSAPPFVFTWTTISNYATVTNYDNPAQTAPRLTNSSAQLYPFVNTGPVDMTGGHFEAANYSKPAWNNAQIIHILMFAVDALPGVGALDNLGIPESGDGISDVLQEAKWEADCLAKMQDADGAFYYMIHPRDREYEYDVLPENGDPQVAWPKNTASTAAAVAALTQCASSPRFKAAYPQAANTYLAKAQLGWHFLTNAIALRGKDGAYQRIMHFDDAFTHNDEMAWAACELFLATGASHYRTNLEAWFPDPTNPDTTRWGWWRMYACYGNTIRDYASAVVSGRLQPNQLDQAYLAKCLNAITNCGNDRLQWSQDNAYGTSFPDPTKRVRDAGWYYSTEQAFDMVVAQQFNPNAAYVDAILRNLNFEAGCNPVNVSYITGLGWKRQREVVDQYSFNDRRALPKIGVPISNIQIGFVYTWTYGDEPGVLCFPGDGETTAPYPFYDRWGDFWNVTTEASTPNTVRCFATALWLAGQTALAAQPWTWTNATIVAPPGTVPLGRPVTVNLQVANPNLGGARITWEAQDQEPAFGGLNYTFTPLLQQGPYWIEAEVQWPDGRRAFATSSINVGAPLAANPPVLSDPQFTESAFSFLLTGVPQASYVVQATPNLAGGWQPVSTNTLPAAGVLRITDFGASASSRHHYRAFKLP